jgi:hypothetical protein
VGIPRADSSGRGGRVGGSERAGVVVGQTPPCTRRGLRWRRLLLFHAVLTLPFWLPVMTIARSDIPFALAAMFEIGGAWLVWQGGANTKGS